MVNINLKHTDVHMYMYEQQFICTYALLLLEPKFAVHCVPDPIFLKTYKKSGLCKTNHRVGTTIKLLHILRPSEFNGRSKK